LVEVGEVIPAANKAPIMDPHVSWTGVEVVLGTSLLLTSVELDSEAVESELDVLAMGVRGVHGVLPRASSRLSMRLDLLEAFEVGACLGKSGYRC
jgi:hypothetical protein